MKNSKIKSRLAVFLAALIALFCIPFIAGCSAETSFALSEDGSYYIMTATGFKDSLSGELVVPSVYGEGENRKPVKEIAQEAFRGAAYSSVYIPESIEKIGMAAFANCSYLQKVTYAEGSPLKEIAQSSFGFCSSLTEVTLPQSVEVIGVYAFYGCTALKSLSLPETVKEISAFAFSSPIYAGMMSLEEINFPQNLEKIGEQAFCYNMGIKKIALPESLKDVEEPVYEDDGVTQKTDATGAPMFKTDYAIGYGAFHTCTALEEAEIPSGVKTVRSGVFGACSALKKVTFGANLQKIEGATFYKTSDGKLTDDLYSGHAFHNCTALADIYFKGTEEEWEAVDIENTSFSVEGAHYDNSAITNAAVHCNA